MKEKILSLLPEMDLIEDEGLREQTTQVWGAGIELGGWKVEELTTIPFTLLIEDCPVDLIQHTRAVTNLALKAAVVLDDNYRDYYRINRDRLIAGALLHDVGKLLEIKKEGDKFVKSPGGKLLRHPLSGAGLATKYDLPEEVVHIIAVHSREGEGGYRSPEAVIVHHADFMNFEPLKGVMNEISCRVV